MMEKLVEVSDETACIDFVLGIKCRATVRLRSLNATAPIAFKIQTSSPHKFLVNPPTGLILPLSQFNFQLILKPQPQIPPSFPRSPSDRFLIRTSVVNLTESAHADTINSTHDIKLKVAFVGPFLLRHAVSNGDCNAVRSMIKIQKTILTELSTREAESLLRVATRLGNSADMVSLLLEAGLKVESLERLKDDVGFRWADKGWTELHVAVAFDRTEELSRLVKGNKRGSLDCRDTEGRTALYLAASKGYESCVRMLAGAGADVDAKRNDGQTALYRAAANGDRRIVKTLLELGADPFIIGTNFGQSQTAIDVARDKGHEDIVEKMERGEEVLNAARHGKMACLESLLERDASVEYRDQYGLSAIHIAAIKGHKDAVMLLVEFGSDVECRDAEGNTPLHLAVEGGSRETVEVLINKGANVNAKSDRGATPLQIAQTMGHQVMAKFLLLHGAVA